MKSEVVGHTPNGREVRRETRDGVEQYVVQPPNDNWWAEGSTPEEALRKAGWSNDVCEQFRGVE